MTTHWIVTYPTGFVCSCHWRLSVDTDLDEGALEVMKVQASIRHDQELAAGYKLDEGWQGAQALTTTSAGTR